MAATISRITNARRTVTFPSLGNLCNISSGPYDTPAMNYRPTSARAKRSAPRDGRAGESEGRSPSE